METPISRNTKDQDQSHGQVRCMKCGKLLARKLGHQHFEIKCPRCGTLNMMLDKMIEQVIITDPQGRILYLNPVAEEETGFSCGEAIGKKISELWGNQMSKKFYADMWRQIRTRKKAFNATLVNKKKTGELYDVDMIISPILNTDGMIIFYVGIEMVPPKAL
jgi:PAS domain S-box-containing protein